MQHTVSGTKAPSTSLMTLKEAMWHARGMGLMTLIRLYLSCQEHPALQTGCRTRQSAPIDPTVRRVAHFGVHSVRAAGSGGTRPQRRNPRAMSVGQPMCEYSWFAGGTNVSLIDLGLVQRSRFSFDPALSLVPEPRDPPKGWRPTTAPVGLSLT